MIVFVEARDNYTTDKGFLRMDTRGKSREIFHSIVIKKGGYSNEI